MKLFFIFSLLLGSCIGANDTIMRRQSLRDGDVIFSEGKRFAFGFFTPGEDSNLRYVGIWYAQISEQTVIWVANRERPVNDTSGLVVFSGRGNLCLYASADETELLWSTNVSDKISEPMARLSDIGNLVVLDPLTGRTLWESFDHPTDTFVPFMRLGFTRQDGLDRFLTSWRSPQDPGLGNYTLRLERGAFPQTMMYNGVTPLWRGGSWTGQRWSGVPEKTLKSIFNISFVNNQDEVSNTYGVLDTSVITRVVMRDVGSLQRFTWNAREKRWIGLRPNPQEQCDGYAYCGPNGYCDPLSRDTLECRCLPGYEPKTPEDWNSRDPSGGCTRRDDTGLTCRGREVFVKLERVKVPDTSGASVDMNVTLKECKQTCLGNCSCVAYASGYYESEGGPRGCLTWHGDMLDTRTYLSSGQDLYVRVDKEELARWNRHGSSRKMRLIWILISLIAAVMLATVMLFCFVRKRQKSNRHTRSTTTFATSYVDFGDSLRFEEQLQDKARNRELPLFELTTITEATDNFSLHNKLGAGGFGSVYKGVLENGMEIAVKRLSTNSGQGMVEFKNEVKLISKLQHRNLVRILGCCVEMEEKMLIYEYLPNKSLDYFIF
ncbi:G-type lectin S-receptor-like serine/threonine-protein kinase RKS1 isoform X3 [Brassica rapa]|nr:G-type lectin S-receptor-like serine/threonine-protein kinase RKS1 isoform X3 [Brassica rapa]